MNYEPIYESKNAPAVGAILRLKKMFGYGEKRSLTEWIDEFGPDNVSMAKEAGILMEVATSQSLVPARGLMKDGDYIVFRGGPKGYILYHMSDGKLWRTVGPTIKDLTADAAEAVEGLDPEEGTLSVAMSGHETIVKDIPAGELRAVVEPEPEEDLDISMEPEPELAPDEEEPIEAPEVPDIQPETDLPLP